MRLHQGAFVVVDAVFVRVVHKNGSEVQIIGSIKMMYVLTVEVLLDDIVTQPNEKDIAHINCKYSGLSQKMVNKTKEDGTVIFGLGQMRGMIYHHVDADTINCRHVVHNDLMKMRLGLDCNRDTLIPYHAESPSLPGSKTLLLMKLGEDIIPGFQATEISKGPGRCLRSPGASVGKALTEPTAEEHTTKEKEMNQLKKVFGEQFEVALEPDLGRQFTDRYIWGIL